MITSHLAALRGLVSLAFLLTLNAALAYAQLSSAGTFSGLVSDQQGAPVSDAAVLLLDTATNTTQRTVTNEAGRYFFLNIAPGVYDLAVSKSGFNAVTFTGQRLQVGGVVALDVTLQVGSVATTVDVTGQAIEVQTTTAAVERTVNGPLLLSLPNLGRDANAFVRLLPAVAPGGEVAGKSNDQNVFMIDGGNISSDQDGNYRNYTVSSGSMATGSGGNPSGVVPTPVESVEEFRVSLNNQTADFNGAAGGQVQMATKRGTDKYHGALYEYYFDNNFSANTWTNNRRGTPKPKTHENRFGASFGGPLTPKWGGAKTFFFVNYEGRRFPQVATYEREVPTKLLRAGVVQIPDSSGRWTAYNLNPRPVTVDGVTYQPALCGTSACDPRGIGLNPIVSQIWEKYMPLPNNPAGGDQYNTQGFRALMPMPVKSNFFVARVDRDLHQNHRLMLSYRYFHLYQSTTSQVDIGGFFPGNTLGVPKSLTDRPQTPSFYIAGLTSVLSPGLINDFRFSYTRNSWEWGSAGAPPQLPGLGAALDFGLLPYETARGNALSRYWNGHDYALRDDLSLVHGNHLFQFGGTYTRWLLQHQRNDNGLNMITTPTYVVGAGEGIATPAAYIPATVPSREYSRWNSLYAQTLGFVSESHVFYPRQGGALLPFGASIKAASSVNNYNAHFSDTWKMSRAFTLTYGMAYEVQMPPYERNGNQPMVVDRDGNNFASSDYLAQREKAALAGSVYQPILGFSTVRNVGEGRKYPFDPIFYGFSPRLSAAWNPSFKDGFLAKVLGSGSTVFRGGYARIFGRINGINIVQVPLQGTGIGQAVACVGANTGGRCLGSSGVDPTSAFRIGADGLSAPLPGVDQILAQPYFPGIGGNAPLGETWILDSKLVPPRTDQFTFSIQRQIGSRSTVEVGYIGMISRNEQWRAELNAVPYMTTLNGQTFASAFANVYQAMSAGGQVASQPFFESAMGGPQSPYCQGFANCTAAVASKQSSDILNTNVRRLWSALDNSQGWTLGRTLTSSPPVQTARVPSAVSGASSNYNAVFVSLTLQSWHGLTLRSNLTFSRALGNGGTTQNGITSMDTFNRDTDYRPLGHDIPWVYNLTALYDIPGFSTQRGVLGQLLGGWALAPLFTSQSGIPLCVATGAESFGSWMGGCAVGLTPYTGGNTAHHDIVATSTAGRSGNPATGGSGINMFTDPQAVYQSFRPMILGVDGRFGNMLRGFPVWNLDLAVRKTMRFRESMGATLSFEFINLFNHFQPANPTLNVFDAASWGVVTGQGNDPRRIEFGLRFFF
jgi:hypothetical protein